MPDVIPVMYAPRSRRVKADCPSTAAARVVAGVMVCVNTPLLVMRRALTMIRGKSESVVERLMNPNTSVDLTDR